MSLKEPCDRWAVELVGKAGIFANIAEQSSDAIVDFTGVVRRPAVSSSTTQTAFVGEINPTVIYRLTNVWGLRAGYNLIWAEGLALAPNQLDFTTASGAGTAINTSGGIFLHGASAGIEARW